MTVHLDNEKVIEVSGFNAITMPLKITGLCTQFFFPLKCKASLSITTIFAKTIETTFKFLTFLVKPI